MERTQTIKYEECRLEELSSSDRALMDEAIAATGSAYAPYSNFKVGAAVRLDNGTIVRGSNQENVAYPSGLCAERTALFAASAQHSGHAVEALAIVARNPQEALVGAMPCGACRQVMAEQVGKQGKRMRVICYVSADKILIFEGIESLLPFVFTM